MSAPSSPKTTSRLLRAARAERADLERQRGRLQDRRRGLADELAALDEQIAGIDDRVGLLDRIAPEPAAAAAPGPAIVPVAPGRAALSGPAIRETAVRLALRSPDRHRLHYRAWHDMLTAAGHTVAGKDPVAVFLTQIGRSPLVVKGTEPGIYSLDLDAGPRLERRLRDLQDQLGRMAGQAGRPADLGAVRARRRALTREIGQVERLLEEIDRVMAPERAGRAAG